LITVVTLSRIGHAECLQLVAYFCDSVFVCENLVFVIIYQRYEISVLC